ncbi:MAG: class I SAM-dependent methyltransferase [Thermotogae bacterium]|nr:class I SAM-dependent methyltransferase [Thermotogota bacterium]
MRRSKADMRVNGAAVKRKEIFCLEKITENHENRLYSDLSWIWPLWGDLEKEYGVYCERVSRIFEETARIPIKTVLDIGCGGGKNLYHLKKRYAVTGLDMSPQMLSLANDLNPACETILGDMRSFSLNRSFDAVLIDDAVSYMIDQAELGMVFDCAYKHLNPGGVMAVTPDRTRENFVQNETTTTLGEKTIKGDRFEIVFVENTYDADEADSVYEDIMVFFIRKNGKLTIETDRHRLGIFFFADWRRCIQETGFILSEYEDTFDRQKYTTFGGLKPFSASS